MLRSSSNKNKAKAFLEYYKERYNPLGRNGLDPRLAKRVFMDYNETLKENLRWYLIVGPGGAGKTTLSLNIAFFFDPKFNADMIVTDWIELAKIMSKLPKRKAKRAILMDEPDLKIHPQSKPGKFIASILNKARQQQLFLIFCSTSLRLIQPFLFEKIHALGYTPQKGQVEFYRDNYEKNSLLLSGVRKRYVELGYKVFSEIRGKKLNTYNVTPLSDDDMDKYEAAKAQDYDENIKEFLRISQQDTSLIGDKRILGVKRYYKIKALKEAGKTIPEIAKKIGLTPTRIYQIMKQYTLEGL